MFCTRTGINNEMYLYYKLRKCDININLCELNKLCSILIWIDVCIFVTMKCQSSVTLMEYTAISCINKLCV